MRIQRRLSGSFDAVQVGFLSSRRSEKLSRGFTLIEMMATIAIGGILLAMAVGAWGQMRENTRVDTAKEQIASMLQQARLQALTSGVTQTVSFDWANNTVNGVLFAGNIDLQKIACSTGVLTNTGTLAINFSRRGTGVSASIRITAPGSSRTGVITVNGTTGRISIKGAC